MKNDPQIRAFLDMIAWSELGQWLIDHSDNGYNVLVGSIQGRPLLFGSYADHPRTIVRLSRTLSSTAAGRYQILARIYDFYKDSLHLPNFSPDSQDKIALQLIRECKATTDIRAGRVKQAILRCSSRWASLPSAGYGQHEHSIDDLTKAFRRAGGTVSD